MLKIRSFKKVAKSFTEIQKIFRDKYPIYHRNPAYRPSAIFPVLGSAAGSYLTAADAEEFIDNIERYLKDNSLATFETELLPKVAKYHNLDDLKMRNEELYNEYKQFVTNLKSYFPAFFSGTTAYKTSFLNTFCDPRPNYGIANSVAKPELRLPDQIIYFYQACEDIANALKGLQDLNFD